MLLELDFGVRGPLGHLQTESNVNDVASLWKDPIVSPWRDYLVEVDSKIFRVFEEARFGRGHEDIGVVSQAIPDKCGAGFLCADDDEIRKHLKIPPPLFIVDWGKSSLALIAQPTIPRVISRRLSPRRSQNGSTPPL